LLRMPTRMVIGTSAFQIVVVTAVTTVLQSVQNHSVDVALAMPLIVGGVVGAQYGIGFAERLRAEQLRAGLALLVLAVAVRMALGLGRAPGSGGRTAFALNPLADQRPAQFPGDVRDLMAWVTGSALPEGHPFAAVRAYPAGETAPEIWMLGSSDYGAQVAAHFGLPYAFAWFFADGATGAHALDL